MLSEQLRQQNNQRACECVCVAEQSHITELVCVSCVSATLLQSATLHISHTHRHTLGHPPFTLFLFLYIFVAWPRSQSECFILVLSLRGFQMQICPLLPVMMVRVSQGHGEVWEGGTGGKCKMMIKGKVDRGKDKAILQEYDDWASYPVCLI